MLSSLNAIVPLACVTAAGLAAMVAEAFRDPGESTPIAPLAIIGLLAAGVSTVLLWGRGEVSFGVVAADNFALFATGIFIVIGLLTVGFSPVTIAREKLPAGEYYALTLFAIAGMILMAQATDLLMIFLALEVMSLAVYVLTGIRRDSRQASEASFKYFLLGAFSSAFFLYGIALTYSLTGSTRLDRVSQLLAGHTVGSGAMEAFAVGLLAVGFAFKVSAVPFHMWTPDAYQAAPPVVTGFMSTGIKAAAFVAFVRVFMSAFASLSTMWVPALWMIAVATMIIGTVVGMLQSNVKRMLAYSSIAHAGYLLVGIVAANAIGRAAVLFYLLTYALTNVGAFGVIALLESEDRPNDELRDYAGLWNTRPGLAALMTIFLLSLGGFPPLAGFVGKWFIFSAAVQSGYYGLAVIGVLSSVVSVFFYLRIVVMMYMTAPEPGRAPISAPRVPRLAGATLAIATIGVFYLGILPTSFIDLATHSIARLF
ncbi:MAG TPA: NADH-quinone oxidoreductase subunit N [Vicinamibacterales bacterium]|jgi:NADH-quinone oxidoreductase subunit N